MNLSPNRRFLTDWMKETLAETLIVGVIDAPLDGGWSDDPRSTSAFFDPYTVITPQTASVMYGTLQDPGLVWEVSYLLASYSVSTSGIEDQADTARRIVCEVPRVVLDLGGDNWKVIGTTINSIGAVTTNRQIEPPVLSQQDSVCIRVSRV